jgi:hypothetical protein
MAPGCLKGTRSKSELLKGQSRDLLKVLPLIVPIPTLQQRPQPGQQILSWQKPPRSTGSLPDHLTSATHAKRQTHTPETKVFLLLFLQKKKNPPSPVKDRSTNTQANPSKPCGQPPQ